MEEASTLARQVYDADPRDPAMIMIYAEVAAARNEWKEVEKSCKQALSLNPDIPRAKELLQACPKPQDSDAP
ncbi:MAG TPA: tetratricopeptide repeat protein [Candidatus Hydrogenedentes bacterium]|nr:tetratricopeptide repeat protein [Candidatus Hydrogenedentota bacterium]